MSMNLFIHESSIRIGISIVTQDSLEVLSENVEGNAEENERQKDWETSRRHRLRNRRRGI